MATSIDTSKTYVMINMGSETAASASDDGIDAVGNHFSFKDSPAKFRWNFIETGENDGTVYRIRNVKNSTYMRLQNNGACQVKLVGTKDDYSRFVAFREDTDPYPTFRFQSVPWGTVLDMKNGHSSDDTPIQSWDWTKSVNEKWLLIPLL